MLNLKPATGGNNKNTNNYTATSSSNSSSIAQILYIQYEWILFFSDSKSGACHVHTAFFLLLFILTMVVVLLLLLPPPPSSSSSSLLLRIGFVFIQNLYNIKHIMCIQCTMWEKNKCNVDRPTERKRATDVHGEREREKEAEKKWMSSNTPATKLQIQNEYIYKKSDEHRVNIVNVTLNHRHKKAKKHKEKKPTQCRANK